MTMNRKELNKCKNDFVYFVEHYCRINGVRVRLKDYQKKFIDWLKRNENHRTNKGTARHPLQLWRH